MITRRCILVAAGGLAGLAGAGVAAAGNDPAVASSGVPELLALGNRESGQDDLGLIANCVI